LDPAIEKTIAERATADGTSVICRDGTGVSAGTHFEMACQEEAAMPQGLGTRHHAAAGNTANAAR